MGSIESDVIVAVEDRPVDDVFVSDLDRIDFLGKNARFTFYVEEFSAPGASPLRRVRAKIIMPFDKVPIACARTLFAFGHIDRNGLREISLRAH